MIENEVHVRGSTSAWKERLQLLKENVFEV